MSPRRSCGAAEHFYLFTSSSLLVVFKKDMNNFGKHAETLAVWYLRLHGYEILARNFRSRFGEIDIIAKDKDCLVFCEVKYRKNENFGDPLSAVDLKKQRKITQTARYYMLSNNISDNSNVRFDVVGILGEKITYVRNAF